MTQPAHETREERIGALIQFWHLRHVAGEHLSAEELCRDCPELMEAVRKRLETNPGRPTDTSSALTLPDAASHTILEESRWPGLDGYALEGVLGEGGMGIVFRARQLFPDRTVAVKMLRFAALPGESDAQRFHTEIHSLARLNHPNIVQVHDAGEHQGRSWYSMEYVPGGSLAQKLKEKPLGVCESAALIETLARAMQAAHEAGIIHRDLKPANVLLAADGTPKIADFGLARQMDADQELTRSGTVLGTPSYMAPEQASGRACSERSDVYTLGVILFELLAGRPPFKGSTPSDTIFDVISMEPPPPCGLNPSVAKDLEAVCLKCLEKKPENRYESAQALAEDLGRWQRGEPTQARPLGPISRVWKTARRHPVFTLAGLLLFGVASILGALFWNAPHRRLDRALRDLKDGHAVSWIDATGPPLWFRDVTKRKDTTVDTDRAVPFSITTMSIAMIELVPEIPLERYRVKARIRHSKAALLGMAGLYLGHRRFDTPAGGENYFLELSLSEHMPKGERLPPGLTMRRLSEDPAASNTIRRFQFPYENSAHLELKAEAVWRDLTVEVTPATIKVWENNLYCGELTAARREKLIPGWLKTNGHLDAKYPAATAGTGLGLYVSLGTAEFQFVTISPLDGR